MAGSGGGQVKIVAEEAAEVFSSRVGRRRERQRKEWGQRSVMVVFVSCIVVGEVVDNNI